MTKIIIHPNKLNRLFKTKIVDYATRVFGREDDDKISKLC